MEDVAHFWRSFDRAWNSRDAAAVAHHFEGDGTLVFIDGREFQTRNEVTEFYIEVFSRIPSDWVHSASIESESELGATGIFRITRHVDKSEVLSAPYVLELSPSRSIRLLSLRKTEPNQSAQRTGPSARR